MRKRQAAAFLTVMERSLGAEAESFSGFTKAFEQAASLLKASGHGIMIAYGIAPFGPIVLVFPFKDLFDNKLFYFIGRTEMHNSETPSSQIADGVAPFQVFSLDYPGKHTVKMDRKARILVLYRDCYVPDGFSAPWAFRLGKRFCGKFWRDPFRAFVNGSAGFIKAWTIAAALPGKVRVFAGFPGERTGLLFSLWKISETCR